MGRYGRTWRTRSGGKVHISVDRRGIQWVVCSECPRPMMVTGAFVDPDAVARRHAETCRA